MTWLTLALLSLAVARVTRALTTDLVAHGLRQAVVRRWPRGRLPGDVSWQAALIHCDACVAFWVAALAVLGAAAGGVIPWPWALLWWLAVAMVAPLILGLRR